MDYNGESVERLIERVNKLEKELTLVKKELNNEVKLNKRIRSDLTKREKELRCHNLLSQIFSLPGLSLEQVLTEILDAIPPAFQFPRIAHVLIEINGRIYKTPGYKSSSSELINPIFSGEKPVGKLIVSYSEDKRKDGKVTFLKEESDLIRSIAEDIGSYIQKDGIKKRAAESEMLYKSFIDASPDSITITDFKGNIRFSSLQSLSIFGYDKADDLINRNIYEFIDKKYHSKAKNTIHMMFDGYIPGAEEYEGVRKDGSRIPIEVNGDFIRDFNGIPTDLIFVTRDISERNKIKNNLVESERRLMSMMSNLPGIAYRCLNDKRWTMLFMSEGCKDLTGYTSNEFTVNRSISYSDIIYPEDRNYIDKTVLNAIRKKDAFELEYRITTAAGEIKYVWEKGQAIYDGDKILFLEGLIIDVTKQKELNNKLEESEKRHRLLFELADDMVFYLDEGRFIDVNPFAIKKLKIENLEDFIGKTPLDISPEIQPDGQTSFDKLWETQHAVIEKGFLRFEWVYLDSNGQEVWLDISLFLLPEIDGKKNYAVCRDITASKKAEIVLQESQRQYREAQKLAEFGHWQYNYIDKSLVWSDEFYRILGFDPFVDAANFDVHLEMIHPEDRQFAREAYLQAIETKETYDIVYRLLLKNGETKYVNERCLIQYDGNNKPLQSLGTVMDITNRIRLELDLKEKEERFEQIAEQSQTVIWEVDINGLFTYVSPTSTKVWGYRPEEVVGKMYYYDLHPEKGREEFIYSTRQFFDRKEAFHELVNLICKKDGSVITVLTNGIPVMKNGVLTGYRGADNDVTEKLKAEKLLADSEKELKLAQQIAKMGSWEVNLKDNSLKWSENMYRLFGLEPYEREITLDFFIKHIHEDDLELVNNAIEEVIKTRNPGEREYRLLKENGEIIWLKNSYVPVFEGGDIVAIKGTNIDITDKKEAEQEILEINKRLKSVLAAIPDLIFIVNDDGTYLEYFIKKGTDLLMPRDQIVGASIYDTFSPNDAAFHISKLKECSKMQKPIVYDYTVESMGEIVYFEGRLVPFSENSVLVISHDITQRKLNEITITKLSRAIEQSPVMKMITGLDGSIEYVNPAFEKITGYKFDEVKGKNPGFLKSDETQESVYENLWETISKGETWQGEWVNRKKSGETYWEDVNISPIRDKEGKIINYLAIKRDITEWKKAQTEISELTLSLEKKVKERTKELHEANIALTAEIKEREIAELELLKARNEAEKANHAKSEFLSRMSHELRTPMNSILGFAQLLEMGIKDEKQRKGIIHILNSGKHLLSLINEVLEISRIEAGKLSFSLEPVKIGNLLIQVAEVLQNYANEKNVKIEIPEISPDIYINADKQRLKQVLLNLVNNAIKYNRENGKVALKIEFGKRTNSKQREVKILVCDTGIGINKKNIKKLFNPFERIGAQETSIEGSGLGLAVSKKLTEAMGGKIGVESSEGNGSIFWIKIPETKFKEQAFDVATEIETGSVLQKKIKGSILYVEDNESNIELVQETINAHRQGIKLHIDRLGSNAISLAKQMYPKLILLDLNLPNMEGEEILNQIMRNKDLSKIPVVIVSADAMREQIDKLVKQGAKDYLTKPIDLNRLLEVVDKYFF